MDVEPFRVAPKDYEQALPVLGLRTTVLAANTEIPQLLATLSQNGVTVAA